MTAVAFVTGSVATAGNLPSFAFDATGADFMLVGVTDWAVNPFAAYGTGCTFDGVAMAAIDDRIVTPAGFRWFGLVAPASGSHTVTVTGSTGSAPMAVAMAFVHAHQTVPLGTPVQAASGGVAGTVAAVSVPGTTIDGLVACVISHFDTQAGLAVGAGQSNESKGASGNTGISMSTAPGGGTIIMSETWTGATEWAIGAVEILPAIPTDTSLSELTVPSIAVCQVITDPDDGSHSGASIYDFVLYVGNIAAPYDSYHRFLSVPIPSGAVIQSAYLTRTGAARTGAGSLLTRFYGESADDAGVIVSSADYTARVRTAALVDWDNFALVSAAWNPSPDLTQLIQEIVDRPGWHSGNAIQIFHEDRGSAAGNYVNYVDFNSGIPQQCAQLVVTYFTGDDDQYGFTIPSTLDLDYNYPTFQARPSTPSDEAIRTRGYGLRDGVRYGCRVVVTLPESYAVNIGYGAFWARGREVIIPAMRVTPFNPDPDLPRMDLLVGVDAGGVGGALWVPGTPSLDPYPPLPPIDSVALATVVIDAGSTVILQGDIVDKRCVINP